MGWAGNYRWGGWTLTALTRCYNLINKLLFILLFFPIKNPLFMEGVLVSRGTIRGTNKESDDDLLSQAQCLLSLARERFTVLFGMGRGGSTLLWSSDERGKKVLHG